MRNLKKVGVILICASFQCIFSSYLYSQTKDIYGNPTINGNLNYPAGSVFNKVNVNTGFTKMMPIKQEEKKPLTISIKKQQEDSTLMKEFESLKYKHGVNKSEKTINTIADSILQEGLLLYKLERIAWVSSDKINVFKSNMLLFNGYISYFIGDSIKTIYYNHDSFSTKIKFDASVYVKDSITEKNVHVKRIDRLASKHELLLIGLCDEIKIMIAESPSMSENKDKVNPNINPIIRGDKLYFYVLPGSFEQTSFYMGEDYIFEYTNDKKLISISPQHKGLIRFHTLENMEIKTSFHTHLPDYLPFITATDICQAKLYGKRTIGVTKYVVNSTLYSSEYNTETDQLIITDNQKKRK